MSAAPDAPRTYLEGAERREQILRIAGELFSERSYDGVSIAEVAKAAGVARGLVNHYFGTKRDLYLAVLRRMLEVPDDLFVPANGDAQQRLEAIADAVDRWLRTVRANRGTWLASIGAQGFGHDPEVEAVLEDAKRRIIDRLIALAWGPPEGAPPELRALLRGYQGYAEAITADWLTRDRPSRAIVHQLLVQGLAVLVDEVLPKVGEAGATTQTMTRRNSG